MPQFDVHRNLGRSRSLYPYLVIVQSGLLRQWDRRVVIPLAPADPRIMASDRRLNPCVVIQGEAFLVAPQEIGNVPLSALGEVVASLREEAEIVIAAIDWMLNRGFD